MRAAASLIAPHEGVPADRPGFIAGSAMPSAHAHGSCCDYNTWTWRRRACGWSWRNWLTHDTHASSTDITGLTIWYCLQVIDHKPRTDDGPSAASQAAPGANANSVRSVARAFSLLSLFTPTDAEWTVSALSRATGLNKSVVTRLMATMAGAGFVAQDQQTRSYRVGGRAFAVGNAFSPYIMFSRLAGPILETLTAVCGFSTSVGVPDGDQFVTCLSTQSLPIRVAPEPGQRQHYHGSSIGKALLAGMPPERLMRILRDGPLLSLGPNTITDVGLLLKDLDDTRARGYSITHEESSYLVGGVATAVGLPGGSALAAIGIAYPVQLVTQESIAQLGKLVLEAAAELCARIAPQGHVVLFQPSAT